jgi:hypothetical protein
LCAIYASFFAAGLRAAGFLGLRLGGLARRRLLPDRLDLYLREPAAMPDVLAVALLRLVLPDQDLVAEEVLDEPRCHLHALRRQLRVAVSTEKEDVRVERLRLVVGQAVDEQALTLLDAVLLAAE